MDLTNKEKAIVISILRQLLPSNVEIFFFGSRIDGTSRRASDLDILLKGATQIDLGLIAMVREKMEESNLPFKVDILDYHSCSQEMLKNISSNIIKIVTGQRNLSNS
ncbi:MAG: nucleotidyltransferase domain-containing protein [Deltaproteobacteria bacterium CG07_land_8_20_14_0_80_38_7]|nr:MAG: nucleotidyltransferase domain-containing protein [Deltaproteobacteria bacterium CG07_land_8_20_14_0_80_38_7]